MLASPSAPSSPAAWFVLVDRLLAACIFLRPAPSALLRALSASAVDSVPLSPLAPLGALSALAKGSPSEAAPSRRRASAVDFLPRWSLTTGHGPLPLRSFLDTVTPLINDPPRGPSRRAERHHTVSK